MVGPSTIPDHPTILLAGVLGLSGHNVRHSFPARSVAICVRTVATIKLPRRGRLSGTADG